jgi:hypothetical protein
MVSALIRTGVGAWTAIDGGGGAMVDVVCEKGISRRYPDRLTTRESPGEQHQDVKQGKNPESTVGGFV